MLQFNFDMTEEELKIERQYRGDERLGMLCGDKRPLRSEIEIAKGEVEEWAAEQKRVETLERIAAKSKSYRRDYSIERRFGK